MLITTALAAHQLGVPHERLLDWVARKLLPIAGEDEEGRVLLREHVVVERGEVLAAEVPERLRSPRLRRLWARGVRAHVLRCGCAFAADPQPHAEPLICCAEARALDATARLAEAFAATAQAICSFAASPKSHATRSLATLPARPPTFRSRATAPLAPPTRSPYSRVTQSRRRAEPPERGAHDLKQEPRRLASVGARNYAAL